MAKNDEVFVDVYPWVKFTSENPLSPRVPVNGVFRHATALCNYFTPAVALLPHDSLDETAKKRVERFIGREITVIKDQSIDDLGEYLSSHCKCWVSIAPDCSGPAILPRDRKYKTLAILHDTFSAQGDYLEQNRLNYEASISRTDAFAYISETAKGTFLEYLQRNNREFKGVFIPYGAPHRFSKIPDFTRRSRYSISLSTVGKKKNISGLADVARYLDTPHYHIGKFADAPERDILRAVSSDPFRFTGELEDCSIDRFMEGASAFFCLSLMEGFSMPPMEAIIAGVPRILLSDIPAHRELYGHINDITFVRPHSAVTDLRDMGVLWLADLPKIDPKWRDYYFGKYHPEAILAYVFEYIRSL